MELVPFDPAWAATASGWAPTVEDTRAWCSASVAPVPADVVAGWGRADDVRAYAGLLDGAAVAYGELWLDEAEVELARLLVDPEQEAVWNAGQPTAYAWMRA